MPLSMTPLEPPRRVLVIEDSATDRLWLRERLAREGLQVAEASDGPSGLEQCLADPPDLILLDLRLPLCDGFEVLSRLKQEERTRAVPVILISGLNSTAEKARGLDLGAIDFVTKPYDPIELSARVRAALRTKSYQDQLTREARRDGLTGLANRKALEERLAHEWSLCRRHPGPLSVWIIDLDHFKRINDAYGHLSGDTVLVRTAAALRRAVRTTDLVARYGGEEFVVVAPHCPLSGAIARAEQFRILIDQQPMAVARHLIPLTVSIGVASTSENDARSERDLLALADQALYQAKQAGRNRVVASQGTGAPNGPDENTSESNGLVEENAPSLPGPPPERSARLTPRR